MIDDARFDALEAKVEQLCNGIKSAADKYADDKCYGKFCGDYDTSVEPLKKDISILMGPDYDAMKDLYGKVKKMDNYGKPDFDEKGIVMAAVEDLTNKIKELRGPSAVEVVAKDSDTSDEAAENTEPSEKEVKEADETAEPVPSDEQLKDDLKKYQDEH